MKKLMTVCVTHPKIFSMKGSHCKFLLPVILNQPMKTRETFCIVVTKSNLLPISV